MRDNLGAYVPRSVWTRHYVLVAGILYNDLYHNNMQKIIIVQSIISHCALKENCTRDGVVVVVN